MDIYVLSAEFGLIPGIRPIPWYDRVMTADRANELRIAILNEFRYLMDQGYGQVCLGLSQSYLLAMSEWESLVSPNVIVTVADGPMATKQAQLRCWLRGEIWGPKAHPSHHLLAAKVARREVVLNGVRLHISREEILEQARTKLAAGDSRASNYREWCARIDGRPVAPKWLVSLISGLPVSQFDASEARRVLLGLGIDVERLT
ncbi:MAG: hypothetical protein ACYDER_17105 [Ktedonobacteraceae bacterium]